MTVMARVVETRAMQYRRTFRASIFTSFLNPVLFLLAMGVGLGTYVDRSGTATQALGGLTYLQVLAPGLLAPRYALHGVFWHWGFGNIASHGCVNLAPKDAAYIFSITHPVLPDGWRVVMESKDDPGTTFRVRDGDKPPTDRRSKL